MARNRRTPKERLRAGIQVKGELSQSRETTLSDHGQTMFRLPHTRQSIYLSASWAEQNRRLNLSIASLLAEEGLIVIGEHPTRPFDLGGMDYPERVDEYL